MVDARISRTYPQPDSPKEHLGPRERAMAVYKYLLGIEPEKATEHRLFPVIEHAFEQAEARGMRAVPEMQREVEQIFVDPDEVNRMLPSLVEEMRTGDAEITFVEGASPDEPPVVADNGGRVEAFGDVRLPPTGRTSGRTDRKPFDGMRLPGDGPG